jgi:hypothetical protein
MDSFKPLYSRLPLSITFRFLPGYRNLHSDWLRVGRPRVRSSSPGGIRIFSFPCCPDRLWGSSSRYRGVKRPRLESDHSPPISAEDKKTWVYTSTSPYVFME